MPTFLDNIMPGAPGQNIGSGLLPWNITAQTLTVQNLNYTGTSLFTASSLNLTGQGTTGNVALKNPGGDHVQYISVNGSDSNDGLSWGTAKATIQVGINAATNNGANVGIIHYGCGTFVGPTTFYNGLSVWNDCSYEVPGVTGNSAWTYTTSLNLANLTGMHWRNVALDFGSNAAGVVIGSAFQGNTFDGLMIERCGGSTVDCLQFLTTGPGGGANNSVNNTIKDFVIIPTIVPGTFARSCISLKGTTSSPTDNFFQNGVCQGFIQNGLLVRANSDTNYFYHFLIFNIGPTQANSGCLVFNDESPTSDVDADGGIYIGFGCLGGFTNTIRAGQSTGNYVMIDSLANGYATLGGNPSMTVQQIQPGPTGATSDLYIGGKLSVCGIVAGNSGPFCAATGAAAGQITSSTGPTNGALYLGTDGNCGFTRNGASNSVIQNGAGNTINLPAGVNGSTFAVALAAGTVTLASGAVTTNTCQTTVTATATGATTTDAIEWSYTTAPGTADALMHVSSYVTSGGVGFTRCNATSASQTGTAMVINWRVVR